MEMNEKDKRVFEVLVAVTAIPKNIIKMHGTENITEFVLHNLCQKECFNLTKAAYFIDNPDFDHLKGVAGFSHLEAYKSQQNHWSEVDLFTQHMKAIEFNNKVRDICLCSMKKNKDSEKDVIQNLSETLNLSNPRYFVWPTKYDNNGVFLFESPEDSVAEEHLEETMHLFGFCSIF